MKAVVYEKKQLVYCDVPTPEPQENQVLVKIHAASLNALDYRSMRMGLIPKNRVFGADIAGVVEAVGAHVTDYCPGDNVAADISGCGLDGFAQFVAVPLERNAPGAGGIEPRACARQSDDYHAGGLT